MAIKRLRQSWVRLYLGHGGISALLPWATAVVALPLGILSLVHQSALRTHFESWINIHVSFGLLIFGFNLMRIYARHKLHPFRLQDICEMSRILSRMVYTLLYAVIGFRQLISVALHIAYGNPIDFNLAEPIDHTTLAGFDLKNDVQAFVASGLASLVVTRVLLHSMWLRVSADQSLCVADNSHP